jgi:hypothetical protein
MNEKRKHYGCKCCTLALFALLTDVAILHAISIEIAGAVLAKEPSIVDHESKGSIQRSSGVTLLSQDLTPAAGHIGAHYFEGDNRSHVWINLNPQSKESDASPVRLHVMVTFPGKTLAQAPDMVEVRADLGYFANPNRIPQPILRFKLDGGTEMDLTAKGETFQFISGSSESGLMPDVARTLIVHITFAALRQVAQSSSVDINALGYSIILRPEDLQSLRRFIDVVDSGVQIR